MVKDTNEVPMDVCDEAIAAAESTTTEVKSTSSGNTNTSSGTIAGTANATSSSSLSHSMLHDCDNSNSSIVGGSNTLSPQTSAAVIDSDINLDQAPSPRHISEQEMHILQVRYTQVYAGA